MTDSDDAPLNGFDREAGVQAVIRLAAVYRMYDKHDQLLYIGSSGNLSSRLVAHADKRWFPLVETIKLEWFPDRDSASAAEVEAIWNERPQINIAGVPRAIRRRRLMPVKLPETSGPVSLSDAVAMQIISGTLEAVRKRRSRDPAFPRPAEQRGVEFLYDVGQLRAYQVSKENSR
jgi:GIY-YIG catalytic domain